MKKYITNLYGHSQESTAMNAQHMVVEVAKDLGYIELGIRGHNSNGDTEDERIKRIEGSLSVVEEEALIIAQVPTWHGIAFDEVLLTQIKRRSEKLVIFVHDFVPLMFVNNRYLMNRYLEAYNLADLVILPSKKMAQALRNEGLVAPIMIQEIWDHLSDFNEMKPPLFEKKLKFAGNVSRFPFVKEWEKSLPLEVFSSTSIENHSHLLYKGWKKGNDLLQELNQGGFGLVWSENIDNQDEREYSEMNVSFKFSTYLAAGLPLVVNKGLAKQEFVEKHGIGFVVSSLDEAIIRINTLSEEEYTQIQQRVHNVSRLVREGFFTKKMLIDLQNFLYLGERNDDL